MAYIIHVLPGFSPHGHNQLSARVTFAFHEDALHCSPYMVLVSAHCRDARPSFLPSFLPSIRKADATFPISCSIAFGKCDGGCGCCGAESACMSACLRSLSHPSISLSILFPPPSASPSTESWSDWRARFREYSLPTLRETKHRHVLHTDIWHGLCGQHDGANSLNLALQ